MKSTCLGCLCSVYVGITTHLTNHSNQAIYKHRHQSMHILNERIMWNIHTHNYIVFIVEIVLWIYWIERKEGKDTVGGLNKDSLPNFNMLQSTTNNQGYTISMNWHNQYFPDYSLRKEFKHGTMNKLSVATAA